MSRSSRLPHRVARHLSVVLVVALGMSGCGSGRSAEAFCSVMDKHKDRYLSAMEHATGAVGSDDPLSFLGGLAEAVSALGDLQRMWEELADVAPEEIRGDVEAVRDQNAEQLASASDAATKGLKGDLSGLAGSLVSGLAVSGSYQRIDTFTRDHCA